MAGGAVEFFMKMNTSETFYFVYFTIIKCAELHFVTLKFESLKSIGHCTAFTVVVDGNGVL